MKRYLPVLLIAVFACSSSKHGIKPPDVYNDNQQDTIDTTDIQQDQDIQQDKGIPKEDIIQDQELDTQNQDVEVEPVSCKIDVDCLNAPITLGECQVKTCNQKTGFCEASWNSNCCINKVFLDENFEKGMPAGWVIKDTNTDDAVTWSVVDDRVADGKKSLYVGDPTCHTYYTGPMTDCKPDDKTGNAGGVVKVTVDIPSISLPPTKGTFILSFYVWSDTEPIIPALTDSRQPDQFMIQVLYGNNFSKSDTIFSNIKIQKTTNGRFKFIVANLQSYIGKTIRIRLIFNTITSDYNFYGGIYLDDIKLSSVCAIDGCHDGDPDSPDSDDCTDDSCILFTNMAGAGYYAHPKDPDCGKECTKDTVATDCPNDDKCKTVECKDNKCVYTDIVPCCNPQNIFHDDFETDDLGQYSITTGPQNKSVQWQISDKRAKDGNKALYYGDTIQNNYNSGSTANYGYILMHYMDIPAQGFTALTFDLFMSTEWDDKPDYLNMAKNDLFYVEVIERLNTGSDAPTKATTVWESGQIKGTTNGKFIPVGIDLTKFAGKKIAIRFNFVTGDSHENTNEGVYLDNLSVDSNTCKEVACQGAWDCMVDGTCRTGDCNDGKCVVTKTDDTCCSFDLDCMDDTDCTNDWCDATHVCKNEFHEGPNCCQPATLKSFDFDSNSGSLADGFDVKNSCSTISDKDPKCSGWHLTTDKSNSGLYSMYFGNGTDYTTGSVQNEPSKGSFETPTFTMPRWADVQVSFKCLILIDPADKGQEGDNNQNPLNDMLTVEVVAVNQDGTDGAATVIASRGNGIPLISTNPDQFDAVTGISIHTAAPNLNNHKVRLRFTFDSKDQDNNNGLGIFIDDIQVNKACPQ